MLKEQGDDAGAQALFDQALAFAPTQYKDNIRQLIAENTAPEAAGEATETPDVEAEGAEAQSSEAPVAP